MSYRLEALRYKPAGFWQLDDDSPFTDYSGYNRAGSASVQPSRGLSLSNAAQFSSLFGRDCIGSFDSPVFIQGKESQPFTLSANVKAIQKTTGYESQQQLTNTSLNPSGEVTFTSWSNGGNTTHSSDTTWAAVGTKSRKLTHSGTNSSYTYPYGEGIPGGSSTRHPIKLGQYLSATVTVKALAACSARLALYGYDTSGSSTTEIGSTGAYSNLAAGEVRTFQIPNAQETNPDDVGFLPILYFVGPDGAAFASAPGDVLLVDAMASYVSDTPFTWTTVKYIDGDQPGCEWLGSPHASKSRTRADVAGVNFMPDPSVAFPWTASNGYASTLDSTRSLFGNTSIKVTAQSGFAANGVSSYTGISASNLIVGETYTFSGYVWIPSTNSLTGTRPYAIRAGSSASQTIGSATYSYSQFPSTTLPKDQWVRVWVNFVPAQNGTINFYVYGSNNVDESVWYDGFMINRGAEPIDYFDGSTPGAAWAGTPNASLSLLYVSDGEQQILGNAGTYDGLLINGTEVSFVTKYTDASECRASYDIQVPRVINLFGVHSEDKNSLYIDGELVAEASIGDEQKLSSYVSADTKLYTGATVTGNYLGVNSVGIYPKALNGEEIAELAQASLKFNDSTPHQYGGQVFSLAADSTMVFGSKTWSSESDWRSGMLWNVTTEYNYLVPTFNADVSLPGRWLDSFSMDAADSIYGIYLNWDGEGATVEVSLDGDNWEEAVRGRKISLVPEGFDPTGKNLQVRVTFDGGMVDDESYLESLEIVGLSTGTIAQPNARPLTITGGTPRLEKSAMEQNDLWGVDLNGGTVAIGTDNSQSKTVEFWVRPTSPNFRIQTPEGTQYRNGQASSTIPVGEWSLVHLVLNNSIDNFYTDPGFESGTSGHGNATGMTSATDNTFSYSGTQSLKVVSTASGASPSGNQITSFAAGTTGNVTMRAKVFVAPTNTGTGPLLRIGGSAVTPTNSEKVTTKGEWVDISISIPLLTSGGSITTYVYSDSGIGDTVWYDDVSFTMDSLVSGDVEVGQLAFYPNQLSATDVGNIYKSYTGQNSVVASDNSDIVVTDSSDSVDIYARNWAINVAG